MVPDIVQLKKMNPVIESCDGNEDCLTILHLPIASSSKTIKLDNNNTQNNWTSSLLPEA